MKCQLLKVVRRKDRLNGKAFVLFFVATLIPILFVSPSPSLSSAPSKLRHNNSIGSCPSSVYLSLATFLRGHSFVTLKPNPHREVPKFHQADRLKQPFVFVITSAFTRTTRRWGVRWAWGTAHVLRHTDGVVM